MNTKGHYKHDKCNNALKILLHCWFLFVLDFHLEKTQAIQSEETIRILAAKMFTIFTKIHLAMTAYRRRGDIFRKSSVLLEFAFGIIYFYLPDVTFFSW